MTTIREVVRKLYLRVRGQKREELEEPVAPRHIMQGHTDWIWSLASIPDSDLVVSGSGDHSCRVWNAKDGGTEGTTMVHGDEVYAIVVSRDGKMMVSGGKDGRIVVWNLESREKIVEWDTSESWIHSLAMSQDSKIVASGHGNGTIRLWNASTGGRIAGPYQLHNGRVLALSFSTKDDSQIASAGSDGHIHVTYSHSGRDVFPPFQAHDDWIQSLVWSPNNQLISASADKTVKYWDSSNGSELPINHNHTGSLNALAISSDGKLLASACGDGTAILWETLTYKPLGSVIPHRTPLVAVALCSDGLYLAAAGKDRKVYIWTLKDTQEVAEVIDEDSISAAPEVQLPPSSTAAVAGPKNNLDNNSVADEDTSTDGDVGEQDQPKAERSWLDQPAVPLHDAGLAVMMSSVVGADKGQAGARDGLDSSQQRRLFDSFSKNILKPFRAVGAALKQSFAVPKQPTQAQVERPPDNLITPPAIPSIQSSGARRTYQRSRSSLRLPSISRSPTAPVDSEPKPIIAARAKDVIAVGRWPAQRRLPGWLKPNDPKNKPWHKYLLKKRQEYLAKSDSESDAGSQTDTDTSPVSQAGAASFTGPLGRNKPLPPVPLPPVKAGPPSTSPSPNVQSRPARTRTPSEISFTSCEMFCMWLWRSEPSWREKYLSRA